MSLCVCGAPALALAQSADPAPSLATLSREEQLRFDELLGKAQRAYDRRQFVKAVELLQEAQLLYAHPRILYKMARAYERSGQLEEAHTHYLLYLKSGDSASDLARIRAEVKRLEKRLEEPALLTLATSPPGATVQIDQEVVGVTPLRHEVPPGDHTVQLVLTDHHTELVRIKAKPGDDLILDRDLEPSYIAMVFKEDDLLATRRRARIIGASSAALGMGSGALFLLARERGDEIEAMRMVEDPKKKQQERPSQEEIDAAQKSRDRIVYGALGLAALSAVGTTWSVLTWRSTRADATQLTVSTSGNTLQMSWQF